MNFSRFACTAVLILGVAPVASAQEQPATGPIGTTGISAETRVAVSGIDVNRLPIDLKRIEQRFRQGQIREERDGLNLRYYIDVFALSPKIVLFTEQDNLRYGPVPYGGPTHQEMIEMMTPRPFRNHGGVDILNPNRSKK